MKKTSAAVIAVLLAATMTACSKTPAASSGAGTVQSATQSVSQSASAALPAASASEPTASANQSAAASGSQAQTEKAAYQDKSYTGDVEETASYSFTLPEFSAPGSAAGALNQFYGDVSQQMIQYVQTDVYKKAQDVGAVGLLSGTYTVEQSDTALTVTLNVTVTYAGSAETETHTRTDTFDLTTGECTGTEKN